MSCSPHETAGLAGLLGASLLAGCGPEPELVAGGLEPPAPHEARFEFETPEGTVMTLDGEPVTKAEVDALAELVARIYPQYTRPHLRRLALLNRIFPLLALAGRHAEARTASPALAADALELAEEGRAPGGAIDAEGDWRDLGFELWSELVARTPELDTWTGPIEIPGRYLVVRIVERPPAGHPEQDGWRVSILEFPYLPEPSRTAAIEAALDECTLHILEPSWNEVVPEGWKHRMKPSGG